HDGAGVVRQAPRQARIDPNPFRGRRLRAGGEDRTQVRDRLLRTHVLLQRLERLAAEQFQATPRGALVDAAGHELLPHALRAHLVQLGERDERNRLLRLADAGDLEQRGEQLPVIQTAREIIESQARQHIADGGEHLGVDDRRGRSDRIEIALKELAKSPFRRPIRTPYRLDLIPLEELRQRALVLRDDARERDGEVVPQREIRFAGVLVLAALQDLENELVAVLAVLPEERLDVLERRRLERLVAVLLVDVADHTHDVLTPADVVRQKIARARGRLSGGSQVGTARNGRRRPG